MSEWKCGRCGIVYTFEQFRVLSHVQVVADDPEPKKNYGYTSVCICGYRFHLDKWFMRSSGVIYHQMTVFHNFFHAISFGKFCKPKEIKVDISTVDLELNHQHFGGQPLYYELMIFPKREGGTIESWYQDRYPDKRQAELDHYMLKNLLRRRRYLITYRWSDYDNKFTWMLELDWKHKRIRSKTTVETETVTERQDPTFAQQKALRQTPAARKKREEMKKAIEELKVIAGEVIE